MDIHMSDWLLSLETWNLNDLAKELNISLPSLKKKMSFWVNNGILKEIETNVYQVMQSSSETVDDTTSGIYDIIYTSIYSLCIYRYVYLWTFVSKI